MIFKSLFTAHEVGLATLQVACEGFVISNSVIFEYKKPAREDRASTCEPKLERSSSDNLLKFTLLQRLEAMDDRLQIKQEPDGSDLVHICNISILEKLSIVLFNVLFLLTYHSLTS